MVKDATPTITIIMLFPTTGKQNKRMVTQVMRKHTR